MTSSKTELGGIVALCFAAMGSAAQAQTGDLAEILSAARPEAVPGEYLIDTSDVPADAISMSAFSAQGFELEQPSFDAGFRLVRTDDPEALNSFAASQGISGTPIPNALLYPAELPADPEADKLWMIDAINAKPAWNVLSDASEVMVAVVDSGVYLEHEDIKDNLWTNPGEVPGNGVDDDGNGFIDDVHGWNFAHHTNDPNPRERCTAENAPENDGPSSHGTHVAGTIGAVGGNHKGVIGVAPRVKIMALRVERDDLCRGFPTDAILKSVLYAAFHGAKVINLSLEGTSKLEIAQRIYRDVGDMGVLLVIAAGNNGIDNDAQGPYGLSEVRIETEEGPKTVPFETYGPVYPASFNFPHQMTVAATRLNSQARQAEFVDAWRSTEWLNRMTGLRYTPEGLIDKSDAKLEPLTEPTFRGSNFGAQRVHIAAPGQEILSTVPVAGQPSGLASGYGMSQGTSMAAPAVAGAAALVWAAFPEMTAVQVKQRLMATARKEPSLDGRVASGHLDLYAALCAPGAPRQLPGCGSNVSEAPRGQPDETEEGGETEETRPIASQTTGVPRIKMGTTASSAPAPTSDQAPENQPAGLSQSLGDGQSSGETNVNDIIKW